MDDKLKILLFSKDLFLKNGFYNTSMDEIAKELRMSKKTIYKHFPTKMFLVEAVGLNFRDTVKENVLKLLNEQTASSLTKIKSIVRFFLDISIKVDKRWFEDLQNHAPQYWEDLDKTRKELILGNLTKIIDEGKEEGLIRDIPTPILMTIFLNAVTSIINPEFLINNNFSLNEAFNHTFNLLLNGIQTKKAKKLQQKAQKSEK
ncbi:MAG: TetR/AcrR family transcriptional regulator [Melioribacteraceae bacterium]